MEKYKIQSNMSSTGKLFRVTVPKSICDSFGWKTGTEVKWTILGKDKLKLEKIKGS